MKKQDYNGLDVLKFICSLLIIPLHINPFPDQGLVYFLSRAIGNIGVPCFFIMSGFFLFSNMLRVDESTQVRLLLRQEKRLVQMFLFWLIPYFIVCDVWWIIDGNIFSNILEYIRRIFFGGAGFFLWYFVALMGALALCFLIRKLPLWASSLICILCYLIGALGGTYSYILQGSSLTQIIEQYNMLFSTTRNGLFFGLPCVYLGYIFAREKENILRRIGIITLGFISIFAFVVELVLCRKYNILFGTMQISIISLAFFVVCCFAKIKFGGKIKYNYLRKLSVLIYVIHPLLIVLIPKALTLFASIELDYYWYFYYGVQCPIIIMLSCLIGLFLIFISKKIKFLRRIM